MLPSLLGLLFPSGLIKAGNAHKSKGPDLVGSWVVKDKGYCQITLCHYPYRWGNGIDAHPKKCGTERFRHPRPTICCFLRHISYKKSTISSQETVHLFQTIIDRQNELPTQSPTISTSRHPKRHKTAFTKQPVLSVTSTEKPLRHTTFLLHSPFAKEWSATPAINK